MLRPGLVGLRAVSLAARQTEGKPLLVRQCDGIVPNRGAGLGAAGRGGARCLRAGGRCRAVTPWGALTMSSLRRISRGNARCCEEDGDRVCQYPSFLCRRETVERGPAVRRASQIVPLRADVAGESASLVDRLTADILFGRLMPRERPGGGRSDRPLRRDARTRCARRWPISSGSASWCASPTRGRRCATSPSTRSGRSMRCASCCAKAAEMIAMPVAQDAIARLETLHKRHSRRSPTAI